jgi:hypothetical protein
MAKPTNREIPFIVKLRNDASQPLLAIADDVAGASTASDNEQVRRQSRQELRRHSGGFAGAATGSGRGITEAVRAGARRYHVGGTANSTAGLRSGEVPVIAKNGEALLPTARMPDGNLRVKAIIPRT